VQSGNQTTTRDVMGHSQTTTERKLSAADGSTRSSSTTTQDGRVTSESASVTRRQGDFAETRNLARERNARGDVNATTTGRKIEQSATQNGTSVTSSREFSLRQGARGERQVTQTQSETRKAGDVSETVRQTQEEGRTNKVTQNQASFTDDGRVSLGSREAAASAQSRNSQTWTREQRTAPASAASPEADAAAAARTARQDAASSAVRGSAAGLERAGLKQDLINESRTRSLQAGTTDTRTWSGGAGTYESKTGQASETQSTTVSAGAAGVNYAQSQRVSAASQSHQASLGQSGSAGELKASAGLDVNRVDAGWSTAGNVGPGGARVGGKAEADYNLARVNAEVSAKSAPLEVGGQAFTAGGTLKGSGEVTAEAKAKAELGYDLQKGEAAAKVNAEAFAGAKAEGELSAEAGPFKATATGSANAGFGGEVGAGATWRDGKLTLDAKLGATVGVGASVRTAVELDVAQIGRAGLGLASNAASYLPQDVTSAQSGVASDVAQVADSSTISTPPTDVPRTYVAPSPNGLVRPTMY
jgi:hypothetical protein